MPVENVRARTTVSNMGIEFPARKTFLSFQHLLRIRIQKRWEVIYAGRAMRPVGVIEETVGVWSTEDSFGAVGWAGSFVGPPVCGWRKLHPVH